MESKGVEWQGVRGAKQKLLLWTQVDAVLPNLWGSLASMCFSSLLVITIVLKVCLH